MFDVRDLERGNMVSRRPGRRRIRGGGAILGIALALVCAGGTRARADQPSFEEYKVKAAYLYNIAKFVTWPDSSLGPADSTFAIGILGSDPFGHDLDDLLSGRMVGGRRIVVRRAETPTGLGCCQILFLSRSLEGHARSLVGQLGRCCTLTVSDMADFGSQGGMITFYLDGDRVRFDINHDAARRIGLVISSQLLALAQPSRGER